MSRQCRLCGAPVWDDYDANQTLQSRVEVKNNKAMQSLAYFHPRCWELLDGMVSAMIKMAQWPELKSALTK